MKNIEIHNQTLLSFLKQYKKLQAGAAPQLNKCIKFNFGENVRISTPRIGSEDHTDNTHHRYKYRNHFLRRYKTLSR